MNVRLARSTPSHHLDRAAESQVRYVATRLGPMDISAVKAHLAQRPSVHQLCKGAFLQEPITVGSTTLLVPLSPIGYRTQAEYVGHYVQELTDASVDQAAIRSLVARGEPVWPVVAVVVHCSDGQTPEELEAAVETQLDLGRQILAWASGDDVTPFGLVTLPEDNSFFRLLFPHSRRRHRLGFGNTGEDFASQIARILQAAEGDERFAFALSLYHDAVRERNPQFQIARFFNCLECMAAKLKTKKRPSRKAVKYLLGLEDGAMVEVSHQNSKIRYDAVEIGGRVRDQLFHGVTFREKDLISEARPAFALYQMKPDIMAGALKGYCELEIARWANGVSRGTSVPGNGAHETPSEGST